MASSPTPFVPSGVIESGSPTNSTSTSRTSAFTGTTYSGERRGHETAGTVRRSFLQQRHADSHGHTSDDLTAGRLRVENPATVDGRHESSDADRSEIRIDVDLDEVRGISTGVRTGAR